MAFHTCVIRSGRVIAAAVVLSVVCAGANGSAADSQKENDKLERVKRLTFGYREQWKKGNIKDALRQLRKLKSLTPGKPRIHYRIATLLGQAERYDKAVQALEEAAKKGFYFTKLVRNNPHLKPIRDREKTGEILERIQHNAKKMTKDSDDPYAAVADAAEPCPNTDSVADITEYYRRKAQTVQMRGHFLGPWPVFGKHWGYLRGKIETLRHYVAEHPDAEDAPEAYIEMIKAYKKLHHAVGTEGPVSPATADRIKEVVKAFKADYPESRLVDRARYHLLHARWQAERHEALQAGNREKSKWQEMARLFGERFFKLSREVDDGKATGLALVQALDFGYAKDNPQRRTTLVKKLRKPMDKYEKVTQFAWSEVRVPLLATSGTPEFAVTDIEGNTHRLKDYEGKVLLLHFWTPGVGFSRMLRPIKRLHKQYADKGLRILGIALLDSGTMPLDKFREWCSKNGVTWPQIYNGSGRDHPMAQKFHLQRFPQLILINRDGTVEAEWGAPCGLEKRIRQMFHKTASENDK